MCNVIWHTEEIPDEWKRAIIIPIHKKKDNWTVQSVEEAAYSIKLVKCSVPSFYRELEEHSEEILSGAQAGFRKGRSTIDQIFTLRQLAEKYEEFSKQLYVCYIDYRKAFDSVWKKGLWRTLRHYG